MWKVSLRRNPMKKMQIAGIQIEVNESDVAAYVRAGYSVIVEEKQPEPAAVVEEKPEKKTGKK